MPSEFDIIARYFSPLAGQGGLGLLDDAALIKPPEGRELVVTTDAIVAGVHFFADDPPETIGRKVLGVNLSDLAAKGAEPLGFLLNLITSRNVQDSWLFDFSKGLGLASDRADCPLLGGDTVFAEGMLTLSVTALGSVPADAMVRRDGAKAGDRIFVTGHVGDAAIGLRLRSAQREGRTSPLAQDHRGYLIDRYLVPRPRNEVAAALRDHAHAAMDVSDGFVGDLTKMISLSGLGADVYLEDVPLSVAARAAIRNDPALLETALTGGDDYEVLATVPKDKASAFTADCLACGIQPVLVGVVQDQNAPIRFLDADGKVRGFAKGSYVHGQN
jgi:thiamine-monophosphate kinase